MAGIDERIEESKNWFERVAEHIPGYKGYKEKELRREADKIQRLYVAERLESCQTRLEDVQLDLTRTGATWRCWASSTSTMRKLRTVRDRVQFADYGYAGLFDTTKVDEEKLDELYQFDMQLRGPRRGASTSWREHSPPTARRYAPTSDLLDERIEALDARFAEREHLITGAGR